MVRRDRGAARAPLALLSAEAAGELDGRTLVRDVPPLLRCSLCAFACVRVRPLARTRACEFGWDSATRCRPARRTPALTRPARGARCAERCVPLDHEDSNARGAFEAFLDAAGIPAAQIHTIDGSLSPAEEAERYEAKLRDAMASGVVSSMKVGEDGKDSDLPVMPRLDCVLLVSSRVGGARFRLAGRADVAD